MTRLPPLSPVVPLAPTHVVGAFACGDSGIDEYLHTRARIELAAGLSQVYVTVGNADDVLAYFTLSPVTVRVEPALLERLGIADVPYRTIGGFLLGRLGVALAMQGHGIGEALVLRAAQIAKREASAVGGAFLAVDPKPKDRERLQRWYAKQDFITLGSSGRMVLPFRLVP